MLLQKGAVIINTQIHAKYDDGSICYNHSTKVKIQQEDYFTHYHDAAELIFVKSGDISYEFGQHRYDVRKDNLILSRAYDHHNIIVNGDGDYDRYCILVDEKILPRELLDRIPKEQPVIDFCANNAVIQIFDKMDFYCKTLPGDIFARLLSHLLEEVLLNVILTLDEADLQRGNISNPVLEKAMVYIAENLITITDLQQICDALYISKSHLHHLFMEHMKVSPKQYILQKRLAIANREICLGEPATQVGEKCGFSDYSTFYRAYKKQFGYSPAQTPYAGSVRISFADMVKGYRM